MYRLQLKLIIIYFIASLIIGLSVLYDYHQFGAITRSDLSYIFLTPGLITGLSLHYIYSKSKNGMHNFLFSISHFCFYLIPFLIIFMISGMSPLEITNYFFISLFYFVISFQFFFVYYVKKYLFIRVTMTIIFIVIFIVIFLAPLFHVLTYLQAVTISPIIAFLYSLILVLIFNSSKKYN